MHSSIVDIRRYCFNGEVVHRLAGVPLRLLFVTNIVLERSLDTGLEHSSYGLFRGNACQVRVRRETFPATTAISRAPKRTNNRSKRNVTALALEFSAHVQASKVYQTFVPRRCRCQSGRVDRGIGRLSDCQRPILHTNPFKAKSCNAANISDAWA